MKPMGAMLAVLIPQECFHKSLYSSNDFFLELLSKRVCGLGDLALPAKEINFAFHPVIGFANLLTKSSKYMPLHRPLIREAPR